MESAGTNRGILCRADGGLALETAPRRSARTQHRKPEQGRCQQDNPPARQAHPDRGASRALLLSGSARAGTLAASPPAASPLAASPPATSKPPGDPTGETGARAAHPLPGSQRRTPRFARQSAPDRAAHTRGPAQYNRDSIRMDRHGLTTPATLLLLLSTLPLLAQNPDG